MCLPNGGRLFLPFRCKRLFPFFGPERAGPSTLIASKLAGHPDERAEDGGAVIADLNVHWDMGYAGHILSKTGSIYHG